MVINRTNKPKHISVLGGMGPFATQRFLRHILEIARDTYGAARDEDYPRMTIESLALPAFTAHGIEDISASIPLLTETVIRIEKSGAEVITIPCNTIHSVHALLQQAVQVPILNIVTDTAYEASVQKSKKAYILATGSTISEGLYASALITFQIEALQPSTEIQKQVELLITILEGGVVTSEAKDIYMRIRKEATELGADAVILGCTELSFLAAESLPDTNLLVIDSSHVLAESLLAFAYSTD
jgi:aspartate racemase